MVNHPAAGKAGVASRLTIGPHWPGLPEPGHYAELTSRLPEPQIIANLIWQQFQEIGCR
jgi:hypothetical protein